MMGCRWRKKLWVDRKRLEEVCIFIKEDIHNVTLQKKAMELKMAARRGEEYIASGARVCSHIQWIKEGDEGSKLYFDFLKQKVVVNKVLGLPQVDGSLVEDPFEVQGMLVLIFSL